MWLFALTSGALATTHVGGDWGGADLIPADGDELSGTFTNVGRFEIPLGARVLVETGTALEVHADTIEVDGILDGDGAGHAGGGAAFAYGNDGYPGGGSGGGEGGYGGSCWHGGGGGGGGHGGAGGRGGYWYSAVTALGGPAVGVLDTTDRPPGSGGGGSGSGCYGQPGEFGGAGGASIRLVALTTLTIDGEVRADGADGDSTLVDFAGGGGGGSGGTILLEALSIDGTGLLTARGGRGGDAIQGIWYALSGGGGGGGGGRIKGFYGGFGGSLTTQVQPGAPGLDASTSVAYAARPQAGQTGTVHWELADPDADGDGISVPFDNCPSVPNTDQTDSDGDGLGDACDGCPTDPSPDSDGDGICDTQDICPDGDDLDDSDGDGQPDTCDPCPLDDPDDSDGDGVCDRRDTCPGFDDNGPDTDGDTVPDLCDNCPDVANEDQDDLDGDGAGEACDCKDFDANVSPLVPEACNGIDDDCDNEVDEAGAEGSSTWYADSDGDGEGDPDNPRDACAQPTGYVDNDRDCNDETGFAWSGGLERCNDDLDNDCDGTIDNNDEDCQQPPEEEEKGCGCAAPTGGAPAAVLPLLALLLRRRKG